jgi:predicted aminopeptidase
MPRQCGAEETRDGVGSMRTAGWRLRLIHVSALLLSTIGLSGCGISYLWHVTVGQTALLLQRRSVEEALRDPHLTSQEQHKLRMILAVRSFAITQLGMQASQSYTMFVQLDRPYVSYNLSAASADAFKPYTWRFPIVGKMPYKGFFDKDYALREQHTLDEQGYDTYLRGIRAYSTLGYFNDPILSSMLAYDDALLINTIIHEMLHQTVWFKGNVSFNESLASFVAEQGTLAYLQQQYGVDAPEYQHYRALRADALVFEEYMDALINRLDALYHEPISRADKLQRKAQILAEATTAYPEVFPRMQTTGYRNFFERRSLNNAVLLAFRVYNRDTTFFAQALAEQDGDLRRMIAYFKTLRADQIPARFRTP